MNLANARLPFALALVALLAACGSMAPGAAPVALVLYFMGSPSRRRQIKAREQAEWEAAQAQRASPTESHAPDAGGKAPAAPEAAAAQPMRKEP